MLNSGNGRVIGSLASFESEGRRVVFAGLIDVNQEEKPDCFCVAAFTTPLQMIILPRQRHE
jgi:hypothetical protein